MSDQEAETSEPTPTFDDLALTDEVRRAITDMGFVEPTPVQLAAYGPAVAGRDLIVQARTGTGKTAGFGIPLVDRLVKPGAGTQALILAPTRELALQSSREISKLGQHRDIRTTAVYGGAPIEKQVRELAQGTEIVSGTPGRVLDHLRRGTFEVEDFRVLVLDEADEMLSMGFAKELNAIVEMLPERRQTMLFSATIDEQVSRLGRSMKDPERISLSSDAVGARGISHFYYLVTGLGKTGDLVRILENEDPETALIFCNTKANTEQVARELSQAGYRADWLNGDLPQGEREKVLGRTRRGELRYLVATDVAARGIDISHVTHVMNYDFPSAVEAYVHRTGRTGRAGRTGTAITLVTPQDLGSLYYLRLQYKIFPVERSLPTVGELQTRKEADRIDLLSAAFAADPSGIDRAVARRLLVHPDAERLIGGLLQTFFGGSTDVDEEAAAARRERPATPVEEAAPEKDEKRSRRSRRREEPRRQESSREDGRESRREEPRESRREEAEEEDENVVYLYVNLGRRDGVRPGEIIGLLVEEGGVDKADIGRIRIRDRHTFVGVPTDRADDIVDQMAGAESHDKELVVERARDGAS